MLRKRGIACFFILLLLAICGNGCIPGDSHVDEEKDPHFQRGRNLASSQDFKGAVEEFEKALETNPRSAAAHFELGWLYDTKINDYAAAIYHYERYLQLQPNSPRAQSIDVRERIRGCKRELANTEFPLPEQSEFAARSGQADGGKPRAPPAVGGLARPATGGRAPMWRNRAWRCPRDSTGTAPASSSVAGPGASARSRRQGTGNHQFDCGAVWSQGQRRSGGQSAR